MEKYNEAKIKLKCTCSYLYANHTDKEFIKDELGNTVENWEFFISNHQDKEEKQIWFTLLSRNKDGKLLSQIDFDEISKNDLSDLIKQLVNLYKEL